MTGFWLVAVGLALPALAQGQRIQGRVLAAADEKPVANVQVRVSTSGEIISQSVTDSLGRFTARLPGSARYRVSTAHIGYAESVGEVEVGIEEQVEIILRVAPVAFELPPILVVSRSRAPEPNLERVGFYERKAGKFGIFFDRADINRRRPFTTSDLLRGTSGVRVIPQGLRGNDIRMTRGEDPNCPPRILIDNVIVRRGGRASRADDSPFDALLQPQDIEAMEVYRSPSEVPTEYGGQDVTCGVIVIWTKHGNLRR